MASMLLDFELQRSFDSIGESDLDDMLVSAVYGRNVDAARRLLERGANPNAMVDYHLGFSDDGDPYFVPMSAIGHATRVKETPKEMFALFARFGGVFAPRVMYREMSSFKDVKINKEELAAILREIEQESRPLRRQRFDALEQAKSELRDQ